MVRSQRKTHHAAEDAAVGASVNAFRRILRRLRLAARKSELATGLSPAQMFVLTAVRNAPGCSVNEVAAATLTDRSSAAAVIDRLVEQRLVTRTRAAQDGRRAAISITPRGEQALGVATPPPTALLIEGLRQLPASRLQSLAAALSELTEAMGIAAEPAGMLFEDTIQKRGARRPRPRTSRVNGR